MTEPIYKHLDGVWVQDLGDRIKGLPSQVALDGTTYQVRSHLHTTLISVKTYTPKLAEIRGLELPAAGQLIRDEIDRVLATLRPTLARFLPDLRVVSMGEPKPRQTIIIRAEIQSLPDFTAELSRRLGLELSVQPSHVTLYAVDDLPIGLTNDAEMAARSRPCTPAELDQWRAAVPDSPLIFGVKL